MNYIGIDLGLSGGVALITQSGYYDAWSIPTVKITVNKKNRRQYNIQAMSDTLTRLKIQRACAAVEAAGMRPGQSAQATKQTGYGEGVWHTILTLCGIDYEIVYPQTWKKQFGLIGQDKQASIETAKRLFPDAKDTIGKKDGLAEALLIAEYRRRLG